MYILTYGESAGSPVAVYTDGSFPRGNGLSVGRMVIFRGEGELYASIYQLGYWASSFEAEMYTSRRSIGAAIDTDETSELYPAADLRTDATSCLNFISQPYKPSAPYHYLSFWGLVVAFRKTPG